MASMSFPSVTKQPLKYIEVPLSKFAEVVPHYEGAFKEHRATVQKLMSLNNAVQLKKEIKDKKRTIKQLRDLLYEFDTLRSQVEDKDLDQFDVKTISLRKIIQKLIQEYTELERAADKVASNEEINKENCNPFDGIEQIQINENINLKHQEEQLNEVEGIRRDVEDLHELYQDLNEMVSVQGEDVDYVEKTTEDTQKNVKKGALELVKAYRFKAVAYPVTGAFLGGILGGPIGLVAGVKVGGIAAVGCAIAGYTGGRWFKKAHNANADAVPLPTKSKTETIVEGGSSAQKKDI